MKRRFLIIVLVLFAAFDATLIAASGTEKSYVAKNPEAEDMAASLNGMISSYINEYTFSLSVDGDETLVSSGDFMLTEEGIFMFSADTLGSAFGCAVNVYDEEEIIVLKGSVEASLKTGETVVSVSGAEVEISTPVSYTDGVLYFPEEFLLCLGFEGSADTASLTAVYVSAAEELNTLPSYFSSADYGRMPSVKNQGSFGACWALAAASAIEAALLPEDDTEISADHIIYNNGFGISGTDGGDQIMSMSYLISWKGPVSEEDDPYGDGETDSSLEALYHVQEIQYISSGDYEAVKEAVMLYGAVETSMYIAAIDGLYIDYNYYNYSQAAYCFTREGYTVNHEVIIIGWDDDYPAENFSSHVSSDGAFICLNSWGTGFGTEGVFYVSYEDAYIGTTCIAYTGIESADNYDYIYQYDDVGWTGNIGYEKNRAYMAAVYTASSDEILEAVGFYAVGEDTDYEVYVITGYTDENSLNINGSIYASGSFDNAGYYTVRLNEEIYLSEGQTFAVIVMVDTLGEGKPLACEMYTETERTSTITTEGKLTYISSSGSLWECTQEKYSANICLKAYTSAAGE